MKKEYYKPDTWLVNLVSPYALLEDSKTSTVGGGGGESGHGQLSRTAFWDEFDEDLLEDLDKDEINEME